MVRREGVRSVDHNRVGSGRGGQLGSPEQNHSFIVSQLRGRSRCLLPLCPAPTVFSVCMCYLLASCRSLKFWALRRGKRTKPT